MASFKRMLAEAKANLVNTQILFTTGIMLLCDPTIDTDNAKSNIFIIKNILSKFTMKMI